MVLTNAEYVRKIAVLTNKVMSLRKDDDYVINQVQMDKLVRLVKFFMDSAERLHGNVEPVNLYPREEHGGVTATFVVFDITGSEVQRFCSVLSACSAVSIDSYDDGICISCTVPNVFVEKEK